MPKNNPDDPVRAVDVWAVISDSAKAIVWLGASVGGVVVILSSIGFFVFYSNDIMLGAELGFRDPAQYVATGGIFITDTFSFVWIVRKLSFELAGAILVFLMMAFSYPLLKGRDGLSAAVRVMVVAVAVLVQYFNLNRMFAMYSSAGMLTGVITDNEVNRLLVRGDYSALEQLYGSLVISILMVTLAVGYWHWNSAKQRPTKNVLKALTWSAFLLKAAAALLTVSCIYMLPQVYGILVYRNIYPVITDYDIKHEGETAIDLRDDKLFLLYRNDKTVVIYDRSKLKLIYLRNDIVNYVSIGSYQLILRGRDLEPE